MLKVRRPLGRLIFNMGIAIPGKTVFLIETAPLSLVDIFQWNLSQILFQGKANYLQMMAFWSQCVKYENHNLGLISNDAAASCNTSGCFSSNMMHSDFDKDDFVISTSFHISLWLIPGIPAYEMLKSFNTSIMVTSQEHHEVSKFQQAPHWSLWEKSICDWWSPSQRNSIVKSVSMSWHSYETLRLFQNKTRGLTV